MNKPLPLHIPFYLLAGFMIIWQGTSWFGRAWSSMGLLMWIHNHPPYLNVEYNKNLSLQLGKHVTENESYRPLYA